MQRGVFALFLCMSLAVTAAASGASVVVIESNVPGIGAGQVIAEGASITVPAGARITFVSESGNTLTVTGPFSGIPSLPGGTGTSDTSLISSLSSLLSTSGQQTSSLGTMKEVSGLDQPALLGPEPTDPWAIDVGRSDTYCVLGDRAAPLWRGDAAQATMLRLENELTGQHAEVAWPAGTLAIDWPAALPPTDGAGYMALLEGAGNASRIVVRFVPTNLPTDPHRIAWMAENGCTRQARLLVSQLR